MSEHGLSLACINHSQMWKKQKREHEKWKRDNTERVETLSKCKVVVRKAKTHLEFYLSRLQRVCQQQKEDQNYEAAAEQFREPDVTEHGKYLVFTAKICLLEFQVPQICGKVWSKEELLSIEEDQIWEYLKKINIHESRGPGTHGSWRSLENVIPRPLSTVLERSWQL